MFRSIDKWLSGYIRSAFLKPRNVAGLKHLMFCVADHFEPFRQDAPKKKAMGLIDRWSRDLPGIIEKYHDADGRKPQHTFFYPQEEYDFDCVEKLSVLGCAGIGEVEIHIHHRKDTKQGFKTKLESFRDTLRDKHGLLGADRDGKTRYGFIHGNWALCNSRPDGDWCGVNEEIGILRQTGCYADFTFPSAPSPTQPKTVNKVYYAGDREGDQGGHNYCGNVSTIGNQKSTIGNTLLLITGPLALDWQRRKWGIFPRIDNGAITAVNPVLPGRIDLWRSRHIHVEGRPDWVFIKVYTHGCQQDDMDYLLGGSMFKAYDYLHNVYNDGKNWSLHYVTAREMYNIIRAAEAGKSGNPGEYRDFEIDCPPVLKI